MSKAIDISIWESATTDVFIATWNDIKGKTWEPFRGINWGLYSSGWAVMVSYCEEVE